MWVGLGGFLLALACFFLIKQVPQALAAPTMFLGLGAFVISMIAIFAYRFIGLAQRIKSLLNR